MIIDCEFFDEVCDGLLIFYYVDCLDYQVMVKVYQDIIVIIFFFDYFVVKFMWDRVDVDIVVEF